MLSASPESSNSSETEFEDILLPEGSEVLLLKPDAIEDGCVPTIIESLTEKDFYIKGFHSVNISKEQAYEMYKNDINNTPDGSEMRKYRIACANNIIGENLVLVVKHKDEDTFRKLNSIKHQSFNSNQKNMSPEERVENQKFYEEVREEDLKRNLEYLKDENHKGDIVALEVVRAYFLEFPDKLSLYLANNSDVLGKAFGISKAELTKEYLINHKPGFVSWTFANDQRNLRGKVLSPRLSKVSNSDDLLNELARNRIHFYRNEKEKQIMLDTLRKSGLNFKTKSSS